MWHGPGFEAVWRRDCWHGYQQYLISRNGGSNDRTNATGSHPAEAHRRGSHGEAAATNQPSGCGGDRHAKGRGHTRRLVRRSRVRHIRGS
jgi:hypothetical protein